MKVFHCPGHCGESHGCEYNGIVEKDWVLTFAQYLSDKLAPTCEQYMGRTGDYKESYKLRASVAAEIGVDLVIMHHINAITGADGLPIERIDGLMTFYKPGDVIGQEVARVMGRCAPESMQQKKPHYATSPHNWTKRADNCLSAYRDHRIPVVLVEYGFATSPNDAEFLQDDSNWVSLFATVAAGVGRATELLRA